LARHEGNGLRDAQLARSQLSGGLLLASTAESLAETASTDFRWSALDVAPAAVVGVGRRIDADAVAGNEWKNAGVAAVVGVAEPPGRAGAHPATTIAAAPARRARRRAGAAGSLVAGRIGSAADVSARAAVVGIGTQVRASAVAADSPLGAGVLAGAVDARADFVGTGLRARVTALAAVAEVVGQVRAVAAATTGAAAAAGVAAARSAQPAGVAAARLTGGETLRPGPFRAAVAERFARVLPARPGGSQSE